MKSDCKRGKDLNDPIRKAFDNARQAGRIALVPFVTAGHPRSDLTPAIVKAIADAGADVIEMGVPFSDPLAEGPTIQKSSHDALVAGATVRSSIEAARAARDLGVEVPLVFMGYYNPVLSLGIERYCDMLAMAGANGLIAADLPAEEAGPLTAAAAAAGMSVVPMVALTSTEGRVKAACRSAGGFVYCVSVLGVTGARAEMSSRVRDLVDMVRRHTDLPVAVGFGISTPEHVQEVASYADGAVVGSALIDAINAGPPESAPERAGDFVRFLAAATQKPN